MSCPLSDTHPTEYARALALVKHRVPLFLARPAETFPTGGSGDTGYLLPKDWQSVTADPSVLSRWRSGMALCAVMGHTLDGLDLDTNKGGVLPPDLMPISYGQQHTPSGGTHDLIAPLRLRSRDGLLPGVDYKGGSGGLGHGFLFLAPTRKLSKVTGQVESYTWSKDLELELLEMVGPGTSGLALAAQITASRASSDDGRPEYKGPDYPDLPPDRREQADRHVETILFDWRVKLGDASGWPEGQTDYVGRGWEALSRDCAWAVARLAVCPWTGLVEDLAAHTYESLLPHDLATNHKCRGKWYEGILEKAAARPANQPPWWSEIFFEQTPVLSQVRQAALSMMSVPEGMLAVLLGRVLAEVPPWVMLPPLTYGGEGGSPMGLNFGVAMVAKSGGGKSSTFKATRRLLGFTGLDQEPIEEGLGSGEGMIDVFLEEELAPDPKKEGEMKSTGRFVLKDDPRVIFTVDEIESLSAAGRDRAGSTLSSTMRTGLTGGPLKTANARAGGRYRRVGEDTYRMIVLAGVQPARADVLLSPNEESVGTPQRFLWARLTDKNLNLPDQPLSWPGPLDWEPPTHWPKVIAYPDLVRDELLAQQRRQVLEETNSAEGHSMLTRLKVAFALAVLHRETEITSQWWSLAGVLIDQSRQVQADCKRILGEAAQAQEISRATRTAKAAVIAEEVVSEGRLETCAKALVARLKRSPGEEFNWNQVKPASRLRADLETTEIIEQARKMGAAIDEYEAQGRVAYTMKWGS